MLTCDIFCRVVDNFGDVGVTWRLARQLRHEFHVAVRLFVDDLASLARLVPALDASLAIQTVDEVDVHLWPDDDATLASADLVIEAFQCVLPGGYVRAMAQQSVPPVWLNLDYLSAESWVADHHLLPSPHPEFALIKYFFFPGFDVGTGGLLRERDFLARRDLWKADATVRNTHAQEYRVFLFGYANRALPALLTAIGASAVEAIITIPVGELAKQGAAWRSSDEVKAKANVRLNIQPFVAQTEFDALLWAHDICIVRGEDSFVRAQWAAKPFVWHIYPTGDGTHWHKLTAFLDRYCVGLEIKVAAAVRELWRAWNAEDCLLIASAWCEFMAHRAAVEAHARNWAEKLAEQPDLATNLMTFVEKSVKI